MGTYTSIKEGEVNAIGTITIPSVQGDMPLTLVGGKSTVFIGANGAGKTRLGVMIESGFQGQAEVHRIAAHRSLTMNTSVQPPSLDRALNQLRYGHEGGGDNNKLGIGGNRNLRSRCCQISIILLLLFTLTRTMSP